METIKLDLFSKSILFILVLGIVGLLIFDSRNWFEEMYVEKQNESYSGIIIKKEIQKENHSIRAFYIDNKAISINSDFYKLMDIGDSIFKKKGDLTVNLYKKDGSIFQFDYDSHYQKHYSYEYDKYFKSLKNKN
ncbi:hypothetical protein [Aquimarina agarilytica]|uniref:hypothetical protein n=1 Tax=Aquimarina agarilytica TaxID=1087449 RepID=UPI0002EB2DB3|nr:hypothetical protein [Aquimarina agarilytica]